MVCVQHLLKLRCPFVFLLSFHEIALISSLAGQTFLKLMRRTEHSSALSGDYQTLMGENKATK